MAIYMVKCPSCGSATELNDEKEFCFCTECGRKILAAEAELYAPADDPTPAPEPEPAYVPQLTLEPDLPAAPAPAYVPEPADETEPAAEPPSEEAWNADAIFEGPPLNNSEQLEYLIMHQPQQLDSVVFRSSDECATYVNSLHTLILDLSDRYRRMNHAEEATCLDFLERGIGYCEYLDTRRMRFLAGTHEENGKIVEDYGTFPVSKTVLKEIKEVREQFVEAYNGFFNPKIASAKAALDETKEKIKALPGLTRFYHSFCTPLMGILSAVLLAVGILAVIKTESGWNLVNTAILVVGAILFIAWVVTTILWIINGASARQLYKAAERQIGEVRTYRGKLKS